MIHSYPDGSTIELGVGNTHPPGWTGQHGNVNQPWVRVNGGPWLPCDARSTHSIRVLIECAVNAEEALEAICPDTEVAGS